MGAAVKTFAKRCGTIVLVLLFFPPTHNVAYGVGQEVGRIVGRVTEVQTNTPLAGGTITVTGPALIGPPREATTDENGQYEVPDLAPGFYDVRVSYSGVNPIYKRIQVLPSVSTPLQIEWSAEMTQTETTVVVEERHLTAPDTSMRESVFAIEKFNYIPLIRNYQNTLSQAPGVIGTGNANVKGGTSRHNRFMIDGLDITDVATNTFRGQWQFDAADYIQIITGGMEAKYNAIGSITNIITKSGSDEFHFDASFYYQPSPLQSFVVSGKQAYDEVRPYADDSKPSINEYDLSFVVGGPILKNRLWYSGSFRYWRITGVQPPGPPLNVQAPSTVFRVYQPRLKLTWAPAAKHRISVQFLADPHSIDFNNNVRSDANTTEPLASFTLKPGGYHLMAEWDYLITPNLDTKVLFGYQKAGITQGPQGKVGSVDARYGVYDFDRPRHLNRRDGTLWGNQQTFSVDERPKFQLDGSVTWRSRFVGPHEFEAGFNGLFSRFTNTVTATGKGVSYVDNSPGAGAPLNQGLCDEDPYVRAGRPDPNTVTGVGCFEKTEISGYTTGTINYNFGLYVQDRWKPTKWLTILPGIRWDRYDDRLQTAASYGDRVVLYGFGPRFAVIADLTGDQKTIFQISYGRATQPVYSATVTSVDIANKQTSFTSSWNDQTKMFENPRNNSGLGASFLDTKNHTPAHSDEVLVRLSREVFKNSVAELEYSFRRISNILDLIEINQIWDPSGARVIGYVNPDVQGPITISTYPHEAYTKYSGFNLIFESRPNPYLDFQGSYTLSWTYGPSYQDALPQLVPPLPAISSQFANPRQSALYSGYALDIDTRHSLKTATTFLYGGFSVGLLFNWSSGTPSWKLYSPVSSRYPFRVRSPQGTEPATPLNDTRSWSEFRTPDVFNVGLTLGYDFSQILRQHIILTIRGANLFNLSAPLSFNRIDNDNFGTVSARQTARRITLGIEYRY